MEEVDGVRVGMQNMDDPFGAMKWNWGWCVVAGLILCGYD